MFDSNLFFILASFGAVAVLLVMVSVTQNGWVRGPLSREAEGEIVDMVDERSSSGSTSRMGSSSSSTGLVVRFVTGRGEVIIASSLTRNSWARGSFVLGQRVRVRYHIKHPERFNIVGFDGPNLTLLWVAMVLVVGAVLFFGWLRL